MVDKEVGVGHHLALRSVDTAVLQTEIDRQHQTILDLTRALEERDEELVAARETNRRLMTELNRISGAGPTAEGRDSPR